MSLSPYALMSLDDLKAEVSAQGEEKDDLLERVANRGSELSEEFLGQPILSRGNLVEYHTVNVCTAEIHTMNYPIISVIEVAEDPGTEFGASKYGPTSILAATTDYQVVKASGLIRRVVGSGPLPWAFGLRAIRITYTSGYATLATVPARFTGYALWIAAYIWQDIQRGQGVASKADQFGNVTRFGLTRHMREMGQSLLPDVKIDRGGTGERDAA